MTTLELRGVHAREQETMHSRKRWMVVLVLVTSMCLLFGCKQKSCDDWYKEVESQCCAGKTNCIVDKAAFDKLCTSIDDKCGSELTLSCSGSKSGGSCSVECTCS